MIVVELHWPGSWVAGSLDDAAAHSATGLMSLMESRLFEAAVALDLFEKSQAEVWAHHHGGAEAMREAWALEGNEVRAIETALRAALPPDLPPEERWTAERDLYDQARRIRQHQKWQAGQVPEQYLRSLPFMHARSYLTALDSIAQTVDQMIGEGWEADALSIAATTWESKVPNVRGVRNTVAHESERTLLRRQGGKPITLQPVDNALVSAPGGVLILNSLNGNRFGCTMADGHYGEVEVGVETLVATAEFVQGVINAFTWTGHPRWSPSS